MENPAFKRIKKLGRHRALRPLFNLLEEFFEGTSRIWFVCVEILAFRYYLRYEK